MFEGFTDPEYIYLPLLIFCGCVLVFEIFAIVGNIGGDLYFTKLKMHYFLKEVALVGGR